MKKLVLMIAMVAFLGVATAPVYAAPDSPKTEQTKKETKKKAAKKSDKECATKSSDCCKSKCDDKSKKKAAVLTPDHSIVPL